MGRIRTIKPEFPQSESIGRLSREARLLFIQLWTLADDEGRLRGSSRILASLLYPFDEDAFALMDTWVKELVRGNFIRHYQIDGNTYIDIPKWLNHQKIDHAGKSRIPPFDESSRILASDVESLAPDLVSRIVVSSTKENTNTLARKCELLYQAYPRKVGKKKALAAIEKALKSKDFEWLLQRVDIFSNSAKAMGDYCPHPATWFNSGCYDDDPADWNRKSNGGSNGHYETAKERNAREISELIARTEAEESQQSLN